jgi:hypothetical protein
MTRAQRQTMNCLLKLAVLATSHASGASGRARKPIRRRASVRTKESENPIKKIQIPVLSNCLGAIRGMQIARAINRGHYGTRSREL